MSTPPISNNHVARPVDSTFNGQSAPSKKPAATFTASTIASAPAANQRKGGVSLLLAAAQEHAFNEQPALGKEPVAPFIGSTIASAPVTNQTASDRLCFVDAGAAICDPKAQMQLGMKYYTGSPAEGIKPNYEKAREWWEKAAAQGNAEAQYHLGGLYRIGLGVVRNNAIARAWYEKAAAQGYALAKLFIANTSHYNVTDDHKSSEKPGVPKPSAAKTVSDLEFLQQRASAGDAVAQRELGLRYYKGHGVERDYITARKWYEKAAAGRWWGKTPSKGDAEAQFYLGGLYEEAFLGVKQNYTTARGWYEKAAVQGHTGAQSQLGVLYRDGHGVVQSYTTARDWWEKAAAFGDAEAQFNLGELYYHGHGVVQSYTTAREWYEKAAARGHAEATGVLVKMQAARQSKAPAGTLQIQPQPAAPQSQPPAVTVRARTQSAAPAKTEQSVILLNNPRVLELEGAMADGRWSEKAAAQGHAEAQYALGNRYFEGTAVRQDFSKAREWYEKAAAQGHAGARDALAKMQAVPGATEHVQPQPPVSELESLQQRAAVGDAEAQYALGERYYRGKGVEENWTTARGWYEKAAAQGHTYAKVALIQLQGIPASATHEWYEKAAAQGHAGAKDALAKMQAVPSATVLHAQPQPAAPAQPQQPANSQPNPAAGAVEHQALLKQQQRLFDKYRDLEGAIAQSQQKLAELSRQTSANGGVDLSLLKGKEGSLVSVVDRESLHLQALKELQKIKENEKAADFHFVFQNTFNKVMVACMVIDTKMLGGAQETLATDKLDKVLDVTTTLQEWAQSIPGVGLILKVFNGPLSGYNNLQRARAIKHTAMLFTGAVGNTELPGYEIIGEMIARQLTLSQISTIEEINTTKQGFFKRQLERYHRLQDKLLSNEDVDTRLRDFAEEQCQILLLAFMKKEVMSRPEPKDVPALVALILKKETPSVAPSLSLSPGLQPVRSLPNPSSDLEARVQALQEARRKDQEELQRLKAAQAEAHQQRVSWEKYQKYEKVFELFLKSTFSEEEVSAGGRGPQNQLQVSRGAALAGSGMDARMLRELAEGRERDQILAIRLAILEEHAGINPMLDRKTQMANDDRKDLFS